MQTLKSAGIGDRKSTTITFVVVLLFTFPGTIQALAVDCIQSPTTLSTQAELDNIQVNYRGSGTCGTDTDGDGMQNEKDYFPAMPNSNQNDTDVDCIGNVCEQTTINDQRSQIVKTLSFTGDVDRACRGIGLINNVLLASIQVQEFGCELWRIDPGGNHELFADINEGEAGSGISYDFGTSPLFNGWYYFGATDGVNGYRMWRTDGVNFERVAEVEPEPGGFEPSWIPTSQVSFSGRNYFMALPKAQRFKFYSTDGLTMRAEPHNPLPGDRQVKRHLNFFDKMIVTTGGAEPWVFDGTEYQLFKETVPEVEGLNTSSLWFYFDEAWAFRADFTNEEGKHEWSHFYTDGASLKQLPHTGAGRLNVYNALGGFIRTREAQYAIGVPQPGEGQGGVPIFRISREASSDYELPIAPDEVAYASGAILKNEALVLENNTLQKLGETSSQDLVFNIPSDWEGSVFKFIGSNAYFTHAYIKESSGQDGSRVWAWSPEEVGLLMSDGTNVVTNADYFRHIGNDIYFYGEDDINGWALRIISGETIKPLPRLAAVTGSWYEPATSGQGFVLHPVDDDRTVISFYGFEDDGSPLWLTGVAGTMLEPGKSIEVTMYVASGGNFGTFTPEQISNVAWGSLNIIFDTCSKGLALFDGLSGQQSMNIVRLAGVEGIDCFYTTNPPKPKTAGITGSWYDPATSGQGLELHSMSDEQMVISFFGYNNDSEQIWLIGLYTGEIAWGEPLQLVMTSASGGTFGGFNEEDITRTDWGTLTINFTDCTNATATLIGIDGEQTMNMVKLAGLQGSDMNCL